LILRKIIKIIATRCQILRLNAPNRLSAAASPQTPLGDLTALPQTLYLDFRGPTSERGEEGREGKGRGTSCSSVIPPSHYILDKGLVLLLNVVYF